ncbi:MAG: orotate phosphoribosyltransferase [Bacteroidota bacterium]
MDKEHILSVFRDAEALLEGHFQLTSGLHSPTYFQCAKVLQHPKYCELLCGEIARHYLGAAIDAVIAPALGGLVVSQEVGRQLRVRSMFAERKEGTMQLRRGFVIGRGERLLVCEDVVTTGGSVGEVLRIVSEEGGVAAGVACIVDRSGGTSASQAGGGAPLFSVVALDVVTYRPESCPLCARGTPVVKPGSRGN